ncbi:MAG TPA: cytochrome c-type biogenesis protein [Paracoccaceae bacterium]|nr:cytochrome c-type biogenesis protein [Paracoccaceae bacterium]
MLALFFSAVLAGMPAGAVQPDEMLDDPVLEARAREISRDIRCLVCRNESIDDSNADLARDLRLLVRERVSAGDSNAEVKDYLVARYGEFVLLMPRFSMGNAALYGFPFVAFLIGLAIMFAYLRRPRHAAPEGQGVSDVPLSEQERQQLERLLER